MIMWILKKLFYTYAFPKYYATILTRMIAGKIDVRYGQYMAGNRDGKQPRRGVILIEKVSTPK